MSASCQIAAPAGPMMSMRPMDCWEAESARRYIKRAALFADSSRAGMMPKKLAAGLNFEAATGSAPLATAALSSTQTSGL